MNIFSCLIYKFINVNQPESLNGIVYIATISMFRGLSFGSLMLCILSQHLLAQNCCNTLFISTAPNNQPWYESQQFLNVNSDNKFNDDKDEPVIKNFANQVFEYCICHKYLDAETGLQYDENGKECNILTFMIHDGTHMSDQYVVSKQLLDLTRSIYFQSVKEYKYRCSQVVQ